MTRRIAQGVLATNGSVAVLLILAAYGWLGLAVLAGIAWLALSIFSFGYLMVPPHNPNAEPPPPPSDE